MARRFIWSGERRGARDRESERARRCHAAYESYMYQCTDVSLWRLPYGFSTKTQKPGALILLYTSRLSSGSATSSWKPSRAWPGTLYPPWIARDASSCMRLCTYARLISLSASHLSLSLSVHCACFVATRLRPALAACNYCVLRTPNRKFPPPRPHEVGVGGACRLGSLNGADQAPTAQGRLLA